MDGLRIIDAWADSGATAHTASTLLGGGPHTVVMDYYENGGDAVAKLAYRQTAEAPDPPDWTAEYFTGMDPAGAPALVRQDGTIGFDWGDGSPDPAIPADGFSARWTRTAAWTAGTYRFAATGDDGIRVLLDGVTVVDGWSDHGPTTFTADIDVAAGEHTVVVEYYEAGGGATARFSSQRETR
ncbi:PA14 domain-containing protein [Actinoplanes philippinensis]|uniref:PA14 domain-containing protein n=1 Tax=Actinoplanes philippinensis TaxID=35752 RepID=UPI0033C374CA